MAARGTIAKSEVEKRIASAFGNDFLGIFDKKLYVNVKENGEMVQVAISLTCPKVPIVVDNTIQIGDHNFEEAAVVGHTTSASGFAPAEITDEERDNIAALMARLGL
jgi:hypothetical protein